MVYKKYIKRGNKLYGPYLYHNVKKDGRVITTYHGKHIPDKKNKTKSSFLGSPKKPSKKFWFVAGFLSLLIILLTINLVFLLQLSTTGKVSLNIQEVYQEGDLIAGDLRLVLKHGELFPADSKLIVDNVGEINEFNLRDLTFQESVEGDFYIEDKILTSFGEGYGILGEKEIYPTVVFSYKVINIGEEPSTPIVGGSGGGESEEPVIDQPPVEPTQEIPTNETQDGSEEPSSGEIGKEIIPESDTGDDVSQETEEPIVEEDKEEQTSSEDVGQETIEEEPLETPDEPREVASEPSSESSTDAGSSDSDSDSGTITGGVVTEQEPLINAKVSKETPFVLELEQGKTIEIIYTTQPVNVQQEENLITVTTEYFEIEKGFGKDYITDELFYVLISLSNLGLEAKQGSLVIDFFYEDLELLSAIKEITIETSEIIENQTIIPEEIINETIVPEINITEQNQTNLTKQQKIDLILAKKKFKVDLKIINKLLESDKKIKVILKTKKDQKSLGKKLRNLDYEVMELSFLELEALGDEVEEIIIDEPINMFVTESDEIIKSNLVRNEFGLTGNGKSICIIDTGVDPLVVSYSTGFDFVNNDSIPEDENGHGTEVANVVKTISPGAEIYIVKIIDSEGVGYESDVLEGLQWCTDQDVDIISFSIGSGSYEGTCDLNVVAELTNEIALQGIFIVAATGNDGIENMASPACASKVVSVSATDKQDNVAGFSNVNIITDLFAPGENIETLSIGGITKTVSGTSMSAPMVAGSVALLLENESLEVTELKNRFKTTGKPIEFENINISRIDVYNAVLNISTMGLFNETLNETIGNETNFSVLDVNNCADSSAPDILCLGGNACCTSSIDECYEIKTTYPLPNNCYDCDSGSLACQTCCDRNNFDYVDGSVCSLLGISSFDWVSGGTGTNSPCCGDDGLSDDFCGSGYESCYNGVYSNNADTSGYTCSCGGGTYRTDWGTGERVCCGDDDASDDMSVEVSGTCYYCDDGDYDTTSTGDHCVGDIRYYNAICSSTGVSWSTYDCNLDDGWICNGAVRENRNYYCDSDSGSCLYSVTDNENCGIRPSWDSDGRYNYLTGGYVKDYTGCNPANCTYTNRRDYCVGETVYDYYVPPATLWSYGTDSKNCNDYDNCVGGQTTFRNYFCNDVVYDNCTYTDIDRDSSSSACAQSVGACEAQTWAPVTAQCCGNNVGESFCDGTDAACSEGVYEIDVEANKSVCNCNQGPTTCDGASCFNEAGNEIIFGTGTIGECCGNDAGENYLNSTMDSPFYKGCCNSPTSCVADNGCYDDQTDYSTTHFCNDTVWHKYEQNNTCKPTFDKANLIVDGNLNCGFGDTNGGIIKVNSLTIKNGGNLELDGVTLIVGETIVEEEGSLAIKNSKNTIWQNDNLIISGEYILTNTTLRINGTAPNESIGIEVISTGSIKINDSSSITNGEEISYRYFFDVSGNFSMEDSNLSYVGDGTRTPSGLYLDSSANVLKFKGNTIKNNYNGIYLDSSGGVIENNSFLDNGYTAIHFKGRDWIVKDNYFEGNGRLGGLGAYALYINKEENITILNNSFLDNNYHIYVYSDGITLDTIIQNNTFEGGDRLFYLYKIDGSVGLIKNNFFKEGGLGVFINDVKNSVIENITLVDLTNHGVYFYGPSINNSFINFNITNVSYTASISSAIHLNNRASAINNTFVDSVIVNFQKNDVEIIGTQSGNISLIFLNTTHNKSLVDLGNCKSSSLCNLTVKWYLDVNVTSPSGALEGATVKGFYQDNTQIFDELTGADGFIARQNLTEYIENSSGKSYFDLYKVNVSKINYPNYTNDSVNMSTNIQLDVFLNAPPIVDSVVLNSSSGFNRSSDNLTVYYDSFDADFDSITNITDWRVNKTSIAVLNIPFDTEVDSVVRGAIRDYSTYKNNATLGNGTPGTEPVWVSEGRVGGAYEFDGVNDHIEIEDDDSLSPAELSVEAWFYIKGSGNFYPVYKLWGFELSYNDTAYGSIGNFGGSVWNGSMGGANRIRVSSLDSFALNQWHHVVLTTVSNFNISLYVNGILKDTKNFTGTPYNSYHNLTIGDYKGGGYTFDGIIDEVRVYNRSLSVEQVINNYLAGLAGHQVENMLSQETFRGDNWSVAVTPNDGLLDGITVLSNYLFVNDTLPTVDLVSPENGNIITNRTPKFVWDGNDADEDVLRYDFNVSCFNSFGGGCSEYGSDNRLVQNISVESYIFSNPFKYLRDNNYYYNWTVRVSDDNGMAWSDWAIPWKFEIQAVVSVNLTTNLINFGSLFPEDSNDTTDDNPLPFLLENDGNSMLNISINFTNLWESISNPSNYFMYKFDNYTGPPDESGSFNSGLSEINWKNAPTEGEVKNVTAFLNWSDAQDSVEIDIFIEVPPGESSGSKKSNVIFGAYLAE
ncbi:MAG: S8 family serine peptidase [archaeon]